MTSAGAARWRNAEGRGNGEEGTSRREVRGGLLESQGVVAVASDTGETWVGMTTTEGEGEEG